MPSQSPAIVVVAFNRFSPVRRLLFSLEKAVYSATPVPLVISVDFSDSQEAAQLKSFLENYNWPHGQKRLIFHKENLGLKKHVLSCGDLSQPLS